MCSRPVRNMVEGGVLERDADRVADRAPLRGNVEPGDARRARRLAAGGWSSMWTVVDLPAPFGPRKP